MALAQFGAPFRVLEHLVDKQHPASLIVEFTGKVGYAPALEIEVVHIHIKAFPVVDVKMLLGIL